MYVCVCLKIFQLWSFTLSLTSPPKKGCHVVPGPWRLNGGGFTNGCITLWLFNEWGFHSHCK